MAHMRISEIIEEIKICIGQDRHFDAMEMLDTLAHHIDLERMGLSINAPQPKTGANEADNGGRKRGTWDNCCGGVMGIDDW